MLRVITPATTTRLTTADAVREQFAIPASVLDATLEAWIDRVSAQIVSYCGRKFATELVREKLHVDGRTTLYLARLPASSLTVTEEGVALAEHTDYHVDAESGCITRLDGADDVTTWADLVQLDYAAGYVLPGDESRTLPHDVEHAAILLAGSLYANETSASTGGGGSVVKAEDVEGLGRIEYFVSTTTTSSGNAQARLSHPTAEILLQPYRVAEFG
jgi:hypothetical protein